jgi:hypothetical protein
MATAPPNPAGLPVDRGRIDLRQGRHRPRRRLVRLVTKSLAANDVFEFEGRLIVVSHRERGCSS